MADLTFTLQRLSDDILGQAEVDRNALSFRTMARVVNGCERMLSQVELDFAHLGVQPSEWHVSETRTGSFTFGLERRSSQKNGHDPFQAETILIDGINLLESSQEGLPGMRFAWLQRLQEIASALRRDGVDHELVVSSGATDKKGRILHPMARQISQMLAKERVSLGSIEGRVELVSVHQGDRKFNVYHAVTGKAVKCDLPADLEDEVIVAMKRRVVVSGVIYRNLRDAPVRVKVNGIRVLPEVHELPSLDELMGSVPDLTGSLSTEEFIRMIRDDSFSE